MSAAAALAALDLKGWFSLITLLIAALGTPAGVMYGARQGRKSVEVKALADGSIAARQEDRADGALTLEVADRWRADNVTLRDEIAGMRTEMRALSADNQKLRERVEGLEQDNAQLHGENDRLLKRVHQLEQGLGGLQAAVTDIS